MQKGDGTYRRDKNCETAVSKAHHSLRFCGFSANAFAPLNMSFLNFVLVIRVKRIWDRISGHKFFEKIPWNFWICHFTLGNSRKSKTLPLDIPQSCVAHLGNSKTKTQDRWKFHMIFSWSLLEIPILFYLTLEFQHALSLIPLGNSMSATPTPLFKFFLEYPNADQSSKVKAAVNLKLRLRLWTCRICIF